MKRSGKVKAKSRPQRAKPAVYSPEQWKADIKAEMFASPREAERLAAQRAEAAPDARLDENGPWILRDRPIPMTYAELRAEGRILERREILTELTERMRGTRGWATEAGKLDAHSVLLDFQQWLEGRGR